MIRGDSGLKEISRVQGGVTEEFKDVSVEGIRARSYLLVYDAARRAAKFGIVVIRQDFKFSHRVGIRVHHGVVPEKVVIIRAINQKGHRFGALSANREGVQTAIALV